MCSDGKTSFLRPITVDDHTTLKRVFHYLNSSFLEDVLKIVTDGIHTETVTLISILTPTHDLLTGTVETEGWRAGGADVLFSALGKDGNSKYQTPDMEMLHDAVIPFLATENYQELREYVRKSLGIHSFFMHSCGDERFPTTTWNKEKEALMKQEQKLRTKIDWEGQLFLVPQEEILEHAHMTATQLHRISRVIRNARIAIKEFA